MTTEEVADGTGLALQLSTAFRNYGDVEGRTQYSWFDKAHHERIRHRNCEMHHLVIADRWPSTRAD